jgi:hypothetical protein
MFLIGQPFVRRTAILDHLDEWIGEAKAMIAARWMGYKAFIAQSDLPDGLFGDGRVQPLLQKYFASPLTQIKSKILPSRSREEGRLAIVTDVGSGMRWTQQRQAQSLRGRVTLQRTAKSCGPGAPTLALRFAGVMPAK